MQVDVCDIALTTGTVLKDRYQIEQIYYWGHTNILYRCIDRITGDAVMVKEFCPYALCNRDMDGKAILCKGNRFEASFQKAYQVFQKECSIVRHLSMKENKYGNHILQYRDEFTQNGTIYFVSDLVEGTSLDEIIGRKIKCNASKVMKTLTATLGFLHQCNILHLDIKPSNVIIRPNEEAVLIDFGTACFIGEEEEKAFFVSKGFSAPELYHHGKIGRETDIYSLGALFYYILSGTVPPASDRRLEGETILELSRMVTIPFPLEDCIMRALQLQPEKRFKNLALLEKLIR